MWPKMRRAALASLMVLSAVPGQIPAVHASTIYEAVSPKVVLDVLGPETGALRLNQSGGDTTLAGEIDGTPFEIYFYNCDGGGFVAPAQPDSACLGLEFRAYFDGYPNDAELVNAWNNAHHYGELWRDDDEDLALQLNVIIEGGVTGANIKANYSWWRRVMQSLDDFLQE